MRRIIAVLIALLIILAGSFLVGHASRPTSQAAFPFQPPPTLAPPIQPSTSQEPLLECFVGGAFSGTIVMWDASGAVTALDSSQTVVLAQSDENVKVRQAETFPFLTVLMAPQGGTSNVRVVVFQASPQTEAEWGVAGIGLLETGPASFLRGAERPGRMTGVVQMTADGTGYRDEFDLVGRDFINHWFDAGSELRIMGTIKLLGATIESSDDYPLVFKMTAQGWVLLYGRGTITPAGGAAITVGQDDSVDQYLAWLDDDNQLMREAAAGALGWLGQQDSRDEAILGLLTALEDPAWEVRRNAAESLGRLHAETAVKALDALFQDEEGDGWVSAVAEESIALIIPGFERLPSPTVVSPTITRTPPPTKTPVPVEVDPCIYVVQPGDLTFSIARELGVMPDELVAANPTFFAGNPDAPLQVGWQLQIPGCGED